jgi:hypothetical protein
MKSILDRSFRYTPSFETDVAETFARIRREQHVCGENEPQAGGQALGTIVAMKPHKARPSGRTS